MCFVKCSSSNLFPSLTSATTACAHLTLTIFVPPKKKTPAKMSTDPQHITLPMLQECWNVHGRRPFCPRTNITLNGSMAEFKGSIRNQNTDCAIVSRYTRANNDSAASLKFLRLSFSSMLKEALKLLIAHDAINVPSKSVILNCLFINRTFSGNGLTPSNR